MARFGLVGPTYTSQSGIADSQRCMNFYPEVIESGQGKSQMALYGTPGLKLFVALTAVLGFVVRGVFTINGRVFAVGGPTLYELTQAGAATVLGPVGSDFQPVSFATNGSAGNQLAICSAGQLYIFNLSALTPCGAIGLAPNTLSGPMGGIQGNPWLVLFCDGYFVCPLRGTNKFQVSALEDGTTWNPLSIQQVSVFPENIGGMIAAYRQLWVFGQDGHAVSYYNSGASAYTPFDVISGSSMEQGIDAPGSLCILDNAPFWIGGNINGGGIAWRANGYTPLRISNHAVETAWASYPKKSSDAVGYAYIDQGHTFWVLRFPSANNNNGATWVYDTATQMWHERGYWGENIGYGAHQSTCHCFAWGMHLVGSWSNANVYVMDINTYTDNGMPIRRWRRTPHISNEQQWVRFDELQVDMEVGDGPQPPLLDGAANPRGPQAMLQWSNNGGKTFGNEHWADIGQAGDYGQRVRWLRMGRARDRVYDLVFTDPVAVRIIEGDLRATPGFQMPQERYAKQLAKVT